MAAIGDRAGIGRHPLEGPQAPGRKTLVGEGQRGDIETLEQLCRQLGPGKTFCAHAPGAVEPLQSAIKYFRSEFEAGITTEPMLATPIPTGIQPNLLNQRW